MALPYIFSSGTIIASAQVNANFAVCALTDFSNTSNTGSGANVLGVSPTLTTPGIGSGGALFAGSTFTVTLKASASTTGSYTFTLPVSGGTTSGWVLSTDGSGGTSWVAPATGSGLVVGGSPVTGGTSGYVLYNNGGTLGNIQAVTSSSASSVVLRDANANITSNAFYAGTTNAAAAGTTTVLTAASTPNNIVTGSGGQTFQLPSALTLPIGATFTFNNNQSSGTISVNNNSSTLVVSVPSGAFTTVSLLTNGSAAGTWDTHAAVPSNVSWSTNTLTWTGTIASGTTWNGAAIGTAYGGTGTSTAFTAGSVHFSGAAGVYSQNNAQFFWDNTNNRLGIGTSSPGYLFTVSGTSSLNGILIDGNIHSIANSSAYTISGGSVFNNGGAIQFFGSTSTPAGALVFQTDSGSGSNERLRIAGNGEIYMAAAQSPTQTYNVGYLGLPQSGGTAKTVNYACVLSDAGQHIWSNSGLTVTIPANSSVAYPVGTTLTIMNAQTTGNVTIAITTDTLYLANTAGTSGSRTLAPLGVSTAIKVGATVWVISGVGLS